MNTPTATLTQVVETAVTDSPERPSAETYGHRDEYPVPATNRRRITVRDGRAGSDGWVYSAHFIGDNCWRHQRIRWS